MSKVTPPQLSATPENAPGSGPQKRPRKPRAAKMAPKKAKSPNRGGGEGSSDLPPAVVGGPVGGVCAFCSAPVGDARAEATGVRAGPGSGGQGPQGPKKGAARPPMDPRQLDIFVDAERSYHGKDGYTS